MLVITGVLFFRRLKINHESHEFILDPGNVVNNNFYESCLLYTDVNNIYMVFYV